ncbi:MAG TPA: DbpA RNA binding domain-containing protein [Gemmatimonadaceae bacterium]|nr:DbpA RNA binding domain-containing protein [Gemmatimonadaceae bacterium]
MEYEERELAGAARSAHVLHVTPRVGGESTRLVQSAIARARDATEEGVALLVIVGERATAYEVASLVRSAQDAAITPLTVHGRANALLQRNPKAVVGAPADLLALIRSSALKLAAVSHVVLLWPETIVADEAKAAELELILGETPRDADRSIIAEQVTQPLEALVDRLAIKPRRLTHEVPVPTDVRAVSYLIVAAEQRASALQSVLDMHDGLRVAVIAPTERAADEARAALAALGIDDAALGRVVTGMEKADGQFIVWYGPPAAEHITPAPEPDSEIVLLATPEELRRLRAMPNALTLTPLSFTQPASEAARRQRALREELSSLLRREPVDAELAVIEPLLAQHDAAEVAAAALRLLGRARKAREQQVVAEQPDAQHRPARPVAAGDQHWTRLFVSVGERDGARRGDLVGAITGEAEISGAQVGKIEMRDTYSLVDVAAPVAEKVVERLTGVSIRGRRVTARLDRGPSRTGPADARRGPPRREAESEGAPRAAREHEEWASRGERLRHSRRPPTPGGEP